MRGVAVGVGSAAALLSLVVAGISLAGAIGSSEVGATLALDGWLNALGVRLQGVESSMMVQPVRVAMTVASKQTMAVRNIEPSPVVVVCGMF